VEAQVLKDSRVLAVQVLDRVCKDTRDFKVRVVPVQALRDTKAFKVSREPKASKALRALEGLTATVE
jgi:hypothetical protein